MRDFFDEFWWRMIGAVIIFAPIIYWFEDIKAWVQQTLL